VIGGGFVTYGKLAGILMLDSRIPRTPGDPGHAQTFPFPVAYGVVEGLPFSDLVEERYERVGLAVAAAKSLEDQGVSFVVADCGLFSLFQERVAAELSVPFVGSALSLIPFLSMFLPPGQMVGVLTGHTGLLRDAHLRAAGADPAKVVMAGMENSAEFKKVVIDRGMVLDPEAMRRDVVAATAELVAVARKAGKRLGAVVIECTNLITFRDAVQETAAAPAYDLVSLVEFQAGGYKAVRFEESYRSFRSVTR
jgi:hypothetical protein